MKTLEDQLDSARADVIRGVAKMPTESASSIRRRQQNRKTITLVASGAIAIALVVGTSQVFPGEGQSLVGTSPADGQDLASTTPADSPPATSGLTPEEEQAIEDALVGDDSDGVTTEDTPQPDPDLRSPEAGHWTELVGGVSVAVVDGKDIEMRIWTKSAVQEPTPASSSDISFLPVPVNATQIAVLIPGWEFQMEHGLDVAPYEKSAQAKIYWSEGSDAVDTVSVDWAADERFGVVLVEARDASILDVELTD